MIGMSRMSILHPEYTRVFKAGLTRLSSYVESIAGGLPETLYHYTSSFSAVNGIIHDREVWFSNIAFLNDVAELDYIKTLANEQKLDPLV